jgi:hypothetical protein
MVLNHGRAFSSGKGALPKVLLLACLLVLVAVQQADDHIITDEELSDVRDLLCRSVTRLLCWVATSNSGRLTSVSPIRALQMRNNTIINFARIASLSRNIRAATP